MIEFRVKMQLDTDEGPRFISRVVSARSSQMAMIEASRQLRSEGTTNCTFKNCTAMPESVALALDVVLGTNKGQMK